MARAELLLEQGRLLDRGDPGHHRRRRLQPRQPAGLRRARPAGSRRRSRARSAARWWAGDAKGSMTFARSRPADSRGLARAGGSRVDEVARILMLGDRAREGATIAEEGLALASEPATRQASRGRVDLLDDARHQGWYVVLALEGEETLAESGASRWASGTRSGLPRPATRRLRGQDLGRMRDYAESGLATARETGRAPRAFLPDRARPLRRGGRRLRRRTSIAATKGGVDHRPLGGAGSHPPRPVGLLGAFLPPRRRAISTAPGSKSAGVVERLWGARESGHLDRPARPRRRLPWRRRHRRRAGRAGADIGRVSLAGYNRVLALCSSP